MKIAVNTRLVLPHKIDGIGLFTLEVFNKIITDNPTVDFILINDRTIKHTYFKQKNVTSKTINPQARHPYLYAIWYQFSLKRFLKKLKPDVFVATDGMIPFKTETKTLAVIHDLNFEHHPEHLPKNFLNFYQTNFPKFAHQATRIATVSEFSKKDICDTYKIDSAKIDVVYNGPKDIFAPIDFSLQTNVKEHYSSGNDFFLFVGTLHPRKNLINLFLAFDNFKTKTNSTKKLLIVGKKMWWTDEIETAFNQLKFKNDIIFAGRVNEKELYKITASAFAMTYVPVFEGFGIPLVEAMSCGTPVITSNVTSMPEVVEEAGLLVDPFSVDDIANAMIRISEENGLREELSKRSLIQAQKFSWQKTADLLWNSIQLTMNNG